MGLPYTLIPYNPTKGCLTCIYYKGNKSVYSVISIIKKDVNDLLFILYSRKFS